MTAKLRKAGHPIWETPIYYYPRSVAEGKKLRYWDGVEAAWVLVRERFKK